jgi:tRNA(adenine34) deaminase
MDQATAEFWMREALHEARKAESEGEVPVGAVVLINEKIVGRGHNHPVRMHDPSAHAEILALRHAAHMLKNYRLPGSTLVVTVEPCVMCLGAMIQARVEDLIFGVCDPKSGAVESHFHLADAPQLNHRISVMSGILAEECRGLLQSFFEARRK